MNERFDAMSEYVAAASWYGQHDAAVLLEDGKKVLVAGGADASGASVKQSAVYDFDTDKWSDPVSLNTARQLHAMALLPDGKVLITGGISAPGGAALDTAEIYDPEAKSWTTLDKKMTAGRWGHSAVPLDDGQILIAGGSTIRSTGSVMALRSAELFNQQDKTFTATKTDMTDARTGHVAVVLQEGKKVLFCGGTSPVGTADDPALAFCELYDSADKAWKPTGSMHYPRSAHTATALSATTVLVTGGRAPGAPGDGSYDPFARSTAEVYDLNASGGTWRDAGPMPAGRALHRAVSLGSGKVLLVGGTDDISNEAGYRSALQYENGGWSKPTGLTEGRWAFAAAASGTKVIVAAGVARTGLAAAAQNTELTKTAERIGS